MKLHGGRATYGELVGVLMLDTRFPRARGDIGNAATYPFPVRYRVVTGARTDRIMGDRPDPALVDPFIEAARALQEDGVAAITTSCGFLAPFQRAVADAVDIPVFLSSLVQVPMVRTMLPRHRGIGVFTERAHHLSDEHFRGVGWTAAEMGATVHGLPAGAVFPRTFIDGLDQLDTDVLRDEMVALARDFVAERPEAGAIVLECTNMAPFARDVQEASRLPVFDINTLMTWVGSAVEPVDFLRGDRRG